MADQTEAQKLVAAQKVKTEREKCRTDKFYLADALGYSFQPDVHTELFNNFISYDPKKAWRDQSDLHDRIVLWPRGHYKSTAVIVDIIQCIINWPNVRILLMQGSIGTTQNLLAEIKSHFIGTALNSRFKDIFPDHHASVLGTVNKFVTPARTQLQLKEATVTVASPKAITTGMHFDAGYFDDLVNSLNAHSAKRIRKTTDEFRSMVPLIDPGGFRVVTGTRYAHGDTYEQIIRTNTNGQWVVSVRDCWTDDGKEVRFPQRTLPDGRVIGFTREQLLAYHREDGGMFASQYLNRPASSAKQLFTEEKMLAAVVSEKDSPLLSAAVLFVDLASSQEEYSDDSVILTGKTDHLFNMYVVDGIGGQWTPSQLAVQVIQAAMKHRPLRILIEGTSASKFFVEYLKVLCRDNGVVLPIDFIKVANTKDAKNIRISSLEGHLRNKRLRFFAGLPVWDKMLEQFTKFPSANHDDYPDTVALIAQVFGGQFSPVTPLSQMRHPLLAEMERQEKQQSFITPKEEYVPDSMGDDY